MIKNILIFLIKAYKILISPVLGNNCRFYPTCSVYAVEALHEHSLLMALKMIFLRILRCNPWSNGGYDPVKRRI